MGRPPVWAQRTQRRSRQYRVRQVRYNRQVTPIAGGSKMGSVMCNGMGEMPGQEGRDSVYPEDEEVEE